MIRKTLCHFAQVAIGRFIILINRIYYYNLNNALIRGYEVSSVYIIGLHLSDFKGLLLIKTRSSESCGQVK